MTLETTPRYDSEQVSETGDHAVVGGGGMAGLLAARVLADVFRTVTIVDKDRPPDEPVVRPGVPQARHVHVMHEAGRATLDDLFPGYSEDLAAEGAAVIDMTGDFRLTLADAYARVVMMERRPTTLLRPRLAWRVLRPTVRTPAVTRSR